jgi:hypothetical protein
MTEEWRPIKNYEGLYEISNIGRVRIVKTGGFRKASITPFGYFRLCLNNCGKMESRFLHRLVLEAFRECPRGKTMVNHINGNKLDNRLENLEWVTASENIKHAYKLGFMDKRGEKNGNNKLTRQDVEKIRGELKSGESQVKIARKFGITPGTIWKIKAKVIWNY